MDYISQLNNFFELSEDFGLEANDQLFYLHLLNMFNRSYWQEELRCTDAVLMKKTKIGSTRTIAKVKNRLMQTGFIEFHKGKNNITVYSLTELLCHKCKAECKARCKARCKVTCKVEGKVPLIKYTPIQSLTQKDKKREDVEDRARETRGETQAATAEKLNQEIKNLWRSEVGNPSPIEEHLLIEMEKKHGVKAVTSAIYKAVDSNSRGKLSTAYVRAILENPLERKERKNERDVRRTESKVQRESIIPREEYNSDPGTLDPKYLPPLSDEREN